jgi:hypothetical protein
MALDFPSPATDGQVWEGDAVTYALRLAARSATVSLAFA